MLSFILEIDFVILKCQPIVFFFRAKYYHGRAETRSISRAEPAAKPQDCQAADSCVPKAQSNVSAAADPVFPSTGWRVRANDLPRNFSLCAEIAWLSRDEVDRGSGPPHKVLQRGFSFFFFGYVHAVEVALSEHKYFIRAKCWASYKKRDKHSLRLVVQDNGDRSEQPEDMTMPFSYDIDYAQCSCVAG